MTLYDPTLVDRLTGLCGADTSERFRRLRDGALREIEHRYRQLLHPEVADGVSLIERRAVAAFVAVLHDEDGTRDHFLGLLRATRPDGIPLAALIEAEADLAVSDSPYGVLPDLAPPGDGIAGHRIAPVEAQAFGPRLTAALEWAHGAALHPGAVSDATLVAAGWSGAEATLLARIVELVGFQARVVAGLRGWLAIRPDRPAMAAE